MAGPENTLYARSPLPEWTRNGREWDELSAEQLVMAAFAYWPRAAALSEIADQQRQAAQELSDPDAVQAYTRATGILEEIVRHTQPTIVPTINHTYIVTRVKSGPAPKWLRDKYPDSR